MARRVPKRSTILIGTHDLISSWSSSLAVLLVDVTHDDDDITQHGGLTPVNRSTEACSLGLQRVSLILVILIMVNWHLTKQGIRWPVSRDHVADSDLEVIEVVCSFEVDRCFFEVDRCPDIDFWLDRRLKLGFMEPEAPLLGLAKSIYYIMHSVLCRYQRMFQ